MAVSQHGAESHSTEYLRLRCNGSAAIREIMNIDIDSQYASDSMKNNVIEFILSLGLLEIELNFSVI